MATYKCVTHGVSLTIEGNKRTFETPPGSIRGMPSCKLLTVLQPQEGKFQNCEIVKEK